VLLYDAVSVALPAATPVAENDAVVLPAATTTDAGTEIIPEFVEERETVTGNSYAFDNATVNVAEVPICKDTGLGVKLTTVGLGRAGGGPPVVNCITGFRLMLLMLFADVVRCATKSNVSPGATVTVNEYGSAVVVVMSVLVNFATPLWRAINRTLPGAL
jgi:hypothetical protein